MKLLKNLIILNVLNLGLVWGIDFTPAPVSSNTFGSLNIGWLHSTITGAQRNAFWLETRLYSHRGKDFTS